MKKLTPENIEKSFSILGIPIIPDKQKIYSAWKKKASQYHPDRADTIQNKEYFHNKFIELNQARDICIEAINSSLLYNSHTTEFNETLEPEIVTQGKKDEWEDFINNTEAYFSKFEFFLNITKSFIKIFFSSLLMSFLSAISGLGIGILILGLLSRAPGLPTFFWILLPIFLIFILFYLYLYLQYLDTFTLKLLIQIGYPFKYYILVWVFENIVLVIMLYLNIEYSIYLFILINLGFLIQYQRIYYKILKVEEILLNKTTSTGSVSNPIMFD